MMIENDSALVKAERAIRNSRTNEVIEADWNNACHYKFNEMVVNSSGRFFLAKGSPLNALNKRPNVR
jgi:hypothetical protein|tara:strand:+ start:316 stop:516 length:201 start_codon:yes stop_codon:yes gene_type:complete